MIDERDIEGKLVREVQERGGLCIKLDGANKKGIQDRLVLLPHARIYFVETKKPNGRMSVLQKVRQRQIERLGFPAYVIWDTEGLDKFLEAVDNETTNE